MYGYKAPAYSIGTAKRLNNKAQETNKKATYLIKTSLVKGLSSSIGFSFSKSPKSSKMIALAPGPADYTHKSNLGSGPKAVFTSKRQKMSVETMPGPCDYSPKLLENSVKYTFNKQSLTSPVHANPGPGTYNPCEISHKCPSAVIGKASRSLNNTESSPGPGSYTPVSHSSSHQYSFTRASKTLTSSFAWPGPADYSPSASFNLSSSAILIPRRPQSAKNRTPGPGSYEQTGFQSSSPKWTFGKQVKETSPYQKPRKILCKKRSNASERIVLSNDGLETPKKTFLNSSHSKIYKSPGPGEYSPCSISKKTPSAVFGKAKKGKSLTNNNPGPGEYEVVRPEKKGISFTKTKKFRIIKFVGPGPGSYETPGTVGMNPN